MNQRELISLLDRFSKLRQRRIALQRKCSEHKNLNEYVIGVLETHGVNCVGDLPMAEQHAVAERLKPLGQESDLESEIAELERLSCELWAQLPLDIFGSPQ